jgi:DNA-directed RNA polymerase specialized sigma24 family protein
LAEPDPVAAVLTRTEIATAIRAFTAAQWARLRQAAELFALGRPIEAEDLLQEAFRRALGGERKCPATVDVVWFLAQAMRSIANAELNLTKRRPPQISLSTPGEPEPLGLDPPDPSPNAAQQLESDQEAEHDRDEIIALFADDPAAQVIVEGLMEGMKGEDLRSLTELDETAYESKRRLIRRRIARHVQGRKP